MDQRRQLSAQFGGIDRDIEAVFLSLPKAQLDDLLRSYGQRYGEKAEAYARATYLKWKAGTVRMSGQTAERLLQLLPPRLSFDARYSLIKKLRAHYLQAQVVTVTTDLASWRQAVPPAVDALVQRAALHSLPSHVTRTAQWLTSEDAKAAQALLARVEQEEALVRTAMLAAEFDRLAALLAHLEKPGAAVGHTIRIPNGEIRVTIAPPRQTTFFGKWRLAMTDRKDDEPALPQRIQGTATPAVRGRENLLDIAVSGLSAEEAQAVRAKAIDARLELDVAAKQAEDRFVNASRDMANTVRLANELDHGRNDYNIDSSFETASGRTSVRVKRATNQSLVVVAVVIAIVILLVFLSR